MKRLTEDVLRSDKETDRQIDKQTDRQIDRETDRHIHIQINRETDRIYKQIDKKDE